MFRSSTLSVAQVKFSCPSSSAFARSRPKFQAATEGSSRRRAVDGRGRGRTSVGRASRSRRGAPRVIPAAAASGREGGAHLSVLAVKFCCVLCQGSQDLHWPIISYHQSHVTLHCPDSLLENKLIPTSKLSGNDGAIQQPKQYQRGENLALCL